VGGLLVKRLRQLLILMAFSPPDPDSSDLGF
jgi:hypothetical protein